jgi:transcriptional regulator with XRE-family HTH domain
MVTIGERIRALREKLGLSQADFGARCKPPIRKEHICHYETGKQIPGWAVLPRIAAAAGISQAELVDGVSFKRATGRPAVERAGASRNLRRRKVSREVHARTVTRSVHRQ